MTQEVKDFLLKTMKQSKSNLENNIRQMEVGTHNAKLGLETINQSITELEKIQAENKPKIVKGG
jgi:hypothetical protein